MTIAKRVIVTGRVQGVFFRDSCRQEASRLGVAGSARNLPDETVEVVAEGDEEAVKALINWCKEGPSYADVDSVEVSDAQPTGASGFRTA
ncbi:MAG TPA: acylphosphatase [Actinomycetota bacterium]|nr:acylphosphatase [Actinomycetota bacterium]